MRPAREASQTEHPFVARARELIREKTGKGSKQSAKDLADSPRARVAFDEVRQIPQIVDGIRCQCGCAEIEGNYSLLSCYEGAGMARGCDVCQGQGRLAFRLHKAGKSLDEIRAAIDERYG